MNVKYILKYRKANPEVYTHVHAHAHAHTHKHTHTHTHTHWLRKYQFPYKTTV